MSMLTNGKHDTLTLTLKFYTQNAPSVFQYFRLQVRYEIYNSCKGTFCSTRRRNLADNCRNYGMLYL